MIKDLKCYLQKWSYFDENTERITISHNLGVPLNVVYQDDFKISDLDTEYEIKVSQVLTPKPVNSQPSQTSSLSEESDRKCRELCEEMSALKASNESEVKALKAQLKTSNDSMETMTEEMENLRQQLITSEKSNQELVAELCEFSAQKICLTQEISTLKAKNEIEVQALIIQLKTSLESMETMVIENTNLKQAHSVSDSSPSCSSIGSHNPLTINSDKTRDKLNSGESETLMAEHKSLRKRYSDLVVTHEEYVSALESAQEESRRYRKCFEESTQERNFAIIERNGLKQ
ncbi:unnamed protein product, partial [Medioppia subpectinata]